MRRLADPALDKLISDARRDRAEYGFAQLRLVVAFLHWHNLKEAPQERILSPLLLLPVELTKRKGVRDQYYLDPTTSEAAVNPALRHHLHQLYGLRLPETVDLRDTPLEQFHRELGVQIRASEPGVTLRLVDNRFGATAPVADNADCPLCRLRHPSRKYSCGHADA